MSAKIDPCGTSDTIIVLVDLMPLYMTYWLLSHKWSDNNLKTALSILQWAFLEIKMLWFAYHIYPCFNTTEQVEWYILMVLIYNLTGL